MGIGDWGLGIGDWGLGPIPNPQFKYLILKNIFFNSLFIILLNFLSKKINYLLFMILFIFFIISILFIKSIKISVIIPFYNAEKYLSDCLESIINQSFRDIEIICINDGSTDKSEQIIKEYSKKDKRIILYNQKNLGAGQARDKGVEISKGEYISFIDSDDLFHNKTLEIAYYNIIKYNLDVVWFDFIQFWNISDIKINEFIKSYKIKNFSMYMCWCCVVWNRVWKASIIKNNNISFGKIISGEDNVFNAKIFPFIKNIKILKLNLVYHRIVQNSLSSFYQNKSMHLFNSIPDIINTWKNNKIIKLENSEKIYYSLFNFVQFINKEYQIFFNNYLIKEKLIFNKNFILHAGIFKDRLLKLQLLPLHNIIINYFYKRFIIYWKKINFFNLIYNLFKRFNII